MLRDTWVVREISRCSANHPRLWYNSLWISDGYLSILCQSVPKRERCIPSLERVFALVTEKPKKEKGILGLSVMLGPVRNLVERHRTSSILETWYENPGKT